MSSNCTLHPNVPLTSYCDTCKDVVCQSCVQLGPHADIRHVVISIEGAVQVKRQFYLAFRDNQIYPLRERVSLKILQLQKLQQQYMKDKKVIEKDVNLQFEGINNRISLKIDPQIIKRQTQIKANQEIINKIDDLAYSFQGLVPFPQRFLMCYKQFHTQLKHLQSYSIVKNSQDRVKQQFYQTTFSKNLSATIAKPTKSELFLPREFSLTLAKAAQLPQYIDKNEFLNNLILKSYNNYKDDIQNAKKEVINTQKKVLTLYNNQNYELFSLQKAYVCAYCLTSFTVAETNEPCSHNKSYKAQPSYKDCNIPLQIKGSKMHYWVCAKKTQRPIPDIKAHSIIRNLQKRQFLNSLKDLKQAQCKLKIYDIEKGVEGAYLEEFKSNDPQSLGKVSPLAFLFIMTNKFQIQETQVLVLSELCHIKGQNLIDYTKLGQLLSEPQKPYHQFLLEEQELQKKKPIGPVSVKYRY